MDSNNLVEADNLNEKDILETIEKLPAGYRTVFLLHVVEGYSHKEIAVQLGIAEGTSRSQFFKARSLLQQKLKKDYGKEFGT
jgi:RNA polymerase sigma-70 factor (ECF subfamily)